MTNRELANQLNEQFELSGRSAVTENVIRQWVDWQLLPKSKIANIKTGSGPSWTRGEVALDMAAKLAQFRKYGLISEKQLVARCYIEGWPIEIETARPVMMNRAKYARSHMSKLLSVDYSKLERASDLTAVKKRALERQLGKQDARFEGMPFEFKGDTGILLTLSALSGNAPPPEILGMLEQAMPISKILGSHWAGLMSLFVSGISGMAGLPDEIDNSLLDSIEHCSDEVFANSKQSTQFIFRAANDPEIMSLAATVIGDTADFVFDQIRQLAPSEWPTLVFLSLCHSQHNSKNQLPKFSN
ncbi:MAG: hypothetical protein ABI668_00160 [Sphingorhabdus sp.]